MGVSSNVALDTAAGRLFLTMFEEQLGQGKESERLAIAQELGRTGARGSTRDSVEHREVRALERLIHDALPWQIDMKLRFSRTHGGPASMNHDKSRRRG